MVRETSGFDAINGRALAYRTWQCDALPRATVVLLHGWGDHGARYGELARALAAAGLFCVAPDMCGHGRSPGPRARVHDFEVLLSDLAVFLRRHASAQPTFLCGHSMGGLLAAHYALRHPTTLAGVIFNSAALAVNPKVSWLKRWMSRQVGAAWPTLSMGALKKPEHMARSLTAQQAYAQDGLIHHGAIDAGTGRCLLAAAHAFERARYRWQTPGLILQGLADELVAPLGAGALALAAPTVLSVREFPDARHDLMLDLGADVLAGEMLAWLDARLAQAPLAAVIS